ncbi:MAG: extracellular solute-binding protein, partial [Chloroflexales bacterium]|nr:extracellular solute-binding protein [Chloroflexales bacterium]
TAAPAANASDKTAITIYTTSDTNITDWMQNTVIPAFTAKYPQYEVQTIDAGDAGTDPIVTRALAALQTGGDPQVELMEGDPRSFQDAVDAGLWYKPTVGDVPNLANVVKDALVTDLASPYRGSQVLLAYNSDEVPENEVPKTFAELMAWAKAHPGKFAYCRPDKGGSGGNFVARAVYEASGNDPTVWKNPLDQKLVDQYYPQAIKLLQELHPSIYDNGAYPAGNNPTLELFASGEVSMISAWSDQALQGISKGTLPPTTKLAQFSDLPMPGGYAPLMIPKNAANLQGAKDFLNFMLSTEMQTSVIKDIGGFPAVNLDTLPQDLQQQFTGVITETVPSWPGGDYGTALVKEWYEKVATNIDPAQ